MIYIRSLLTNVFFFLTLMIGCTLQLFVALLPRKATIYFWDKMIMPIALFWIHFFVRRTRLLHVLTALRSKENQGILLRLDWEKFPESRH